MLHAGPPKWGFLDRHDQSCVIFHPLETVFGCLILIRKASERSFGLYKSCVGMSHFYFIFQLTHINQVIRKMCVTYFPAFLHRHADGDAKLAAGRRRGSRVRALPQEAPLFLTQGEGVASSQQVSIGLLMYAIKSDWLTARHWRDTVKNG